MRIRSERVEERKKAHCLFLLHQHGYAASYLPSFLRSYFGAPFTLIEVDEEALASWVTMTSWARSLIFTPACPRFVREHPEEARSFYLILTERAANLPTWIYKVGRISPWPLYEIRTDRNISLSPSVSDVRQKTQNNTIVAHHFFPQFLPFIRVFSQILAAHLPTPSLPSLSTPIRIGLTDMAKTVIVRIPSLQTSIPASSFEDVQFSAAHCLSLGSEGGYGRL